MLDEASKGSIKMYKDRLNILLNIVQTINEDFSPEKLVEEIEVILVEQLKLSKVLIFTLYKGTEWSTLLTNGVSEEIRKSINIEADLLKYTQIEAISIDHPPHLSMFDAIIPLFHRFKPIGFVLIGYTDDKAENTIEHEQQLNEMHHGGDLDGGENHSNSLSTQTAIPAIESESGDRESKEQMGLSPTIKHLKLIQLICNLVIVSIENKKMEMMMLEEQTMQKEMELATKIQLQLIPEDSQLPKSPRINIQTFYHPHFGIGGDYYDFIQLSKSTIGFCIADVSGKGISAAMLMSNFQAVFRTVFTANIDLKKLIQILNERVLASTYGDRFITIFLAKYDMSNGKMTYVNAGHLPPFIKDPKKTELIRLNKGCIGLGMLDTIPSIEVGKAHVPKNGKFIAFTDGLIELERGDSIQSDLIPIETIIQSDSTLTEALGSIKESIYRQLTTGVVFDDVTVIAFEAL